MKLLLEYKPTAVNWYLCQALDVCVVFFLTVCLCCCSTHEVNGSSCHFILELRIWIDYIWRGKKFAHVTAATVCVVTVGTLLTFIVKYMTHRSV